MIQACIWDLDGFQVEGWGTTPLPGVIDALIRIKALGVKVGVATNQSGPLWRIATGDPKYPTTDEVSTRLAECAAVLDLLNDPWCVAVYDEKVDQDMRQIALPRLRDELDLQLFEEGLIAQVSLLAPWRKPGDGMLQALRQRWSLSAAEVIFGGDHDTDRQAAAAAGMRFVWTVQEGLALLEQERG